MHNKPQIKKTIILGVPQHFFFNKVFSDQLEALGFIVYDISLKDEKFRYKNVFQRLYNLFRKVILQDLSYKDKLKEQRIEEKYNELFSSVKTADYALFVRPDLFPSSVVARAKSLANLTVGYQWDGLKRYPSVLKHIPIFDRFFVFDPVDLELKGMLPLTNFFIDQNQNQRYKNTDPKYDILFVGTYIKERMVDIYRFFSLLDGKTDLHVLALLNLPNPAAKIELEKKGPLLKVLTHDLDYYQNIELVKQSRTLVDFSNYQHDGLSFRVLESIGLEKKLITTQASVKKYDFYDEQNILIIGPDTDYELVESFLKVPYRSIDPQIKQKYAFSNWIKYVLNIEGAIPIRLPSPQK